MGVEIQGEGRLQRVQGWGAGLRVVSWTQGTLQGRSVLEGSGGGTRSLCVENMADWSTEGGHGQNRRGAELWPPPAPMAGALGSCISELAASPASCSQCGQF